MGYCVLGEDGRSIRTCFDTNFWDGRDDGKVN